MALDRPSSLIQPNPARIQISLFLVAHSIKGWCDTGYANFNVSSFFSLFAKNAVFLANFFYFLSYHSIYIIKSNVG